MSKRLMWVLALALIVGLAIPVYAEVQNVKVSGDIAAMGISRTGFYMGTVDESADDESHAASIIRLRVDADLTENVGATIRLLNERDWAVEAANTNEIDLDLGYITLKEFLYSPLTLTIGRQELQFGSGFIVGDVDTNNTVAAGNNLTDEDLSARKAFDAVRATLNYDPLILDILWAKIQENTVIGAVTPATEEKDDIDLFGLNARYDFGGNWKTIGELYLFRKVDNTIRDLNLDVKTPDTVNTIGARIDISPKQRLNIQGELAIQKGKVNNKATANSVVKKDAMGAQTIITYLPDMKYSPVLTLVGTYVSGDKDGAHVTNSDAAWDPMFENQISGHIINVLFNQSDCYNFNLRGSMVPIEDLTLTLDYVWLGLAEYLPNGTATMTTYTASHTAITPTVNGGKRRTLGNELDLTLNYDYTSDVHLGLLAGVFKPGDVFIEKSANVKEVIASVKVDF